MQKFFSFLGLLLIVTVSFSQSLERKIDQLIVEEFNTPSEPGGVFLVAVEGKPIYRKAFGKANLALAVEMTPEQVFQIGSMTKQFTAIAILILEEQEKLSVEDPISEYLPDYPNGDAITINQLLTHSSGIKDFTRLKRIAEIAEKEMTP